MLSYKVNQSYLYFIHYESVSCSLGGQPTFEDLMRLAGETIIFECLLTASQLQGSIGVTWMRDDGTPLPLDRVHFTCSHNQTLILRNATNPDDTANYICNLGGQVLGFFFVSLFGKYVYQIGSYLTH